MAVLAVSSLVLQPVSAGVLQCVNCCSEEALATCCQDKVQSSCCIQDAACCQNAPSSCCEEPGRREQCSCGEQDEPAPGTPLPTPPNVANALDALALAGLVTWQSAAPVTQRIDFEQSPVARSVAPAKQLMLCVWRT